MLNDCKISISNAEQYAIDNDISYVIDDEAFVEEDYALCVKKGNSELLNKVNQSLAKLKQSGKFDEIVAKYIKAE